MTKQVTKSENEPMGARFVASVQHNAQTAVGKAITFGKHQQKLCQHLFIKMDQALKTLEAKRAQTDTQNKKTPITWANVNMEKLATDAVYRIDLGLDALIENHIHVIPYFNGKLNKYDVDLRPGYAGKDMYYRNLALNQIVDIRFELIHETDKFTPLMRGHGRDVESYTLEIKDPFNRGKVVGGFGYIAYDDPKLNKLVLVDQKEFDRAKSAAMTKDFWGKDEIKMQYKTIVHRTCKHIVLDPKKVNQSFAETEAADMRSYEQITEDAGKTAVEESGTVDFEEAGGGGDEQAGGEVVAAEFSDEEKADIMDREREEAEAEQKGRKPNF